MASHSHRDDVGGFLVKKAHIAQNTERMTNYTTKQKKETLTSKLWGSLIIYIGCATYKHCKVSEIRQINKKFALKLLICL